MAALLSTHLQTPLGSGIADPLRTQILGQPSIPPQASGHILLYAVEVGAVEGGMWCGDAAAAQHAAAAHTAVGSQPHLAREAPPFAA
jgi:hypothetical protein